MKRVAILAVGLKGEIFVERLLAAAPERGFHVVVVYSYGPGDVISTLCRARGVRYVYARKPTLPDEVDLALVVGWQWLLETDQRLVVFHDSKLPQLRGFCPMATALIRGDQWVGVTALLPGEEADTGPILMQRDLLVTYPAKIRSLLEWAGRAMSEMALEVVAGFGALLRSRPQDYTLATHSIWRDEDDLEVDWTCTAQQIRRFVDAVGDPYPGAWIIAHARGRFMPQKLRVLEVAALPERIFAIRQPGKLWLRDEVVCGQGMIRLMHLEDEEGQRVTLGKLKQKI